MNRICNWLFTKRRTSPIGEMKTGFRTCMEILFIYLIPLFIAYKAIGPMYWPIERQPGGFLIGCFMLCWAYAQAKILYTLLG